MTMKILLPVFWLILTASFAQAQNTNNGVSDEEVMTILEEKCNVCHRKEQPFIIFKSKNLERNRKRIKQQVFDYKLMPKGDEIKLTESEKVLLMDWLGLPHR